MSTPKPNVGLDPEALAQVTILRQCTLNLESVMKVYAITSTKEMLSAMTPAEKRAHPKAIHKQARAAETLEDFIGALAPLDYAYFVKNGPLGKVLIAVCCAHAKRWHDRAFMKSLGR